MEYHNDAKKHSGKLKTEKECSECDFVSESSDLLKSHIAQNHGKQISVSISDEMKNYIVVRANKRLNIAKRLSCTKCSYSAKTKLIMKKHIENHIGDGERILTCKKCDFSTTQFGEHRNHKQTHFYEKRCTRCDFKTTHLKDYRNHKENHCQGQKRFKADPLKEKHLEEIINQLEEIDTSFSCTKCDYTTKHKGRYKAHSEKNHTRCNECGYIGNSGNDMKNHIVTSHPEHISESATSKKGYIVVRANRNLNIAKMFKCCKCDYSSKTRLSMKKHLEKHKSDGLRVFNCSKCDFTTRELADHRYHKREHRLRKKCPKCDFSTKNLAEYKTHRNLHKKGKHIDPLQNDFEDSFTPFKEESSLEIIPTVFSLDNLVLESVPSTVKVGDNTAEMANSLKKMNQIADALKNLKESKSRNVSLETRQKPTTEKESLEPNGDNSLKIEENIDPDCKPLRGGKEKKGHFSKAQVGLLESIYQRNNFPRREMKKNAALRTGLSLAKVQSIFYFNQSNKI